jgi:enterochelin esterase-like enzyme
MPEALVVAITNTDRNRDMPVPQSYGKGGEENFLTFLADELIPEVKRRYRTVELRILLGHSQGGLFAIYALANKPAAFQWYLAMDAPLAGFAEMKPLMEKARTTITNKTFQATRLSRESVRLAKGMVTPVQAAPKVFTTRWNLRTRLAGDGLQGVYSQTSVPDYAPKHS